MKKITSILIFITISTLAFAKNDKQIIPITVTGNGKNIEEAKLNALRSAIEQTYGAFISSETKVLNEELTKDEITSISVGNINSYDLVSETQLSDGRYSITLIATVSLSKLSQFAQSKGVKVNFDGEQFGIDVKLKLLNEEAEKKSIASLITVCNSILSKSLDYSISAQKPIKYDKEYLVALSIECSSNKNIRKFYDLWENTLKCISMTKNEQKDYITMNQEIYRIDGYFLRSVDSYKKLIAFLADANKYIFNFNIDMGNHKINASFVTIDFKGADGIRMRSNFRTYNNICINSFYPDIKYSFPIVGDNRYPSQCEFLKYYISPDKKSGYCNVVWQYLQGKQSFETESLIKKNALKYNLTYYYVADLNHIENIKNITIRGL
jgi:hypothetical protein